jgi:hypothetical protein
VPVALHRKHQCSLFRRQRPDANAHLYGILYSCWSWDVVSSQDLCCSDCAAVPRDGPMARRGKHLPCSIPMDADQHCFRRHTLSPLVFHNNWMETTEIGCRTRKWTRTQVSRAGHFRRWLEEMMKERPKASWSLRVAALLCLGAVIFAAIRIIGGDAVSYLSEFWLKPPYLPKYGYIRVSQTHDYHLRAIKSGF